MEPYLYLLAMFGGIAFVLFIMDYIERKDD